MFGFDELAGFTHSLETAFDEVRNGRLTITPSLIDLTLGALDQIRRMLQPAADSGSGSNASACADILTQVQRLTNSTATVPPPAAATQSLAVDSNSGGDDQTWSIRFSPGPEMMRNGSDPLLLLRELGELGKLNVRASMAAVPPLAELEPERCYICWDLTLATRAGADAIRDVFIFVEDSCDLAVQPVTPDPLSAADRTATVRKGRQD